MTTNKTGVEYDWIKSYLCERKQYSISGNSCNSEAINVVCGSMLGPKLFILYVNDVANGTSLLRFVLFVTPTIFVR